MWDENKQYTVGLIICLPDAGGEENLGVTVYLTDTRILMATVQALTNVFEMLRTEVKQASRSWTPVGNP